MSLSSASSNAPPVAVPAKRPSSFLLAIGLAAVLTVWSVNYIAGKITLAHIAAFTLIPFRAELVGALLLAIYFAQPKARRTPLRKRDIWTFAYLGFFGYAVNQGCFVLGLSHTTSQHSVVIVSLGPIIILLLASAMKLEKLTPSKLLGMAISFAGVVFLESEHGSPMNSPLLAGDLIVLCGTLGFSLYTVLGKRVARSYDSISMNALGLCVCIGRGTARCARRRYLARCCPFTLVAGRRSSCGMRELAPAVCRPGLPGRAPRIRTHGHFIRRSQSNAHRHTQGRAPGSTVSRAREIRRIYLRSGCSFVQTLLCCARFPGLGGPKKSGAKNGAASKPTNFHYGCVALLRPRRSRHLQID